MRSEENMEILLLLLKKKMEPPYVRNVFIQAKLRSQSSLQL